MKGVKKCGLLLALSITLGSSFVISSGVSALKYNINTIPLASPGISVNNPNMWSDARSFEIVTSDDIVTDDLPFQYVFSMQSGDKGVCEGAAYTKLPYIGYSDNKYYFHYGFLGYNFIPPLDFNRCQLTTPINNYSIDSVGKLAPLIGSPRPEELTSLLPYRFSYDGFYRTDSYSSNGLHYDTKIDFLHSLFDKPDYIDGVSNIPNTIYSMRIPLGPTNENSVSLLTPGMPINFSGEFVIDLEDPSLDFGFSQDTSISLWTEYVIGDGNGTSGPDITPCTYSLNKEFPDDTNLPTYSLKYSCSTVLRSGNDSTYPFDSDMFPEFRLVIDFHYSTSNTKFYQFIFDSSVTITNNDSTPATHDWNKVPHGNDTSVAPGSSSQYDSEIENNTPNYQVSLVDMFNFTFLNPFAPIFQLFSDNQSCAQIPTIAGMIHSEETQVCPWFPSSVRNIVTPVLGLSSMMLIFGFAVRWLGARSGNMMEDNFSGDVGGLNIGTRGRSKK